MLKQTARTQTLRSKQPGVLSAEPNKAMQEMMNIIDSLKDIYVRENEALTTADTDMFLELQNIKLDTAREYQQSVDHMLKNRVEMRTAHPDLKGKLAVMQQEFAELGQKNMEALQRMQRCTQRLGDTIMNAARDEVRKQRTVNYAQNGVIAGNEKRGVSMGVSETA